MVTTVEQVGIGHPDKVADKISDAILDKYLMEDKNSRVAIETLIKDKNIIVAGEITSTANVNIEDTIIEVLEIVGYKFYPTITKHITIQSKDIAQGVDTGGAGDQGVMVGYAINETKEYMPLAHELATVILKRADKLRRKNKFKCAKSDMKIQVTIDDITEKLDTIILSIQHSDKYNEDEFYKYIKEVVVLPVIEAYNLNKDYKLKINPTGKFVIGGSEADTGLTGRKIVADSYGSVCAHGGGAFSGKDPSKVDRSGAYITRKIAKHIVASKMADIAEVKISYGIGIAKAISLDIECYGTEIIDIDIMKSMILKEFDLTPNGIIKELKLKEIKYIPLSSYGHFGINAREYEWEKLDKVDIFKQELEKYTIIKKEIKRVIEGGYYER